MIYTFYVDNFYITSYDLPEIKTNIAHRLAKEQFANDYGLSNLQGITIKRRDNF